MDTYGWIPSFLALNILCEYKIRGHKGFEDIDFFDVLSEYEVTLTSDIKIKHFKCAVDVIETISNAKYKFKKIRK